MLGQHESHMNLGQTVRIVVSDENSNRKICIRLVTWDIGSLFSCKSNTRIVDYFISDKSIRVTKQSQPLLIGHKRRPELSCTHPRNKVDLGYVSLTTLRPDWAHRSDHT